MQVYGFENRKTVKPYAKKFTVLKMKTVSKNIYGFENRKQKNLRFWNRKKSEIWFTVLKTVRGPYGSKHY